jgi:hypothetical protein
MAGCGWRALLGEWWWLEVMGNSIVKSAVKGVNVRHLTYNAGRVPVLGGLSWLHGSNFTL